MIRREEVFKIGHIGKPHGLQGEVQFLFTDDVFDRVEADYLVIDMEGILVPFFMESYRFRSDEMALVTFEDIDTEEKARRLSLHDVYFPKSLADADAQLSGGVPLPVSKSRMRRPMRCWARWSRWRTARPM